MNTVPTVWQLCSRLSATVSRRTHLAAGDVIWTAAGPRRVDDVNGHVVSVVVGDDGDVDQRRLDDGDVSVTHQQNYSFDH